MVSLVVPLETFGKEGIIEFFKISMLLLILFGHWFNIQPFGGCTNFTKFFCTNSVLIIFNNWQALLY